MGMARTL
jgi:hypothetical protein